MSTHNICFCREIRKILCGYPLLFVAMTLSRKTVSPELTDVDDDSSGLTTLQPMRTTCLNRVY